MNISTSSVPIRRRGGRSTLPIDEENASSLMLGPEFQLSTPAPTPEDPNNVNELITLNLSEARILIRAALKERCNMLGMDQASVNKPVDEWADDELAKLSTAPGANEVLNKTLEHLNKFSRFRDAETCATADALLRGDGGINYDADADDAEKGLHPFERAQLGSLSCEDVDEAVTLIPSLQAKQNEINLQRVLDELNRLETNYA
ncbi:DNA-directed RNA polymerase II subunit [Martiniozyma asiatica (nom. inval.)]|nr:DNA-directed RNA polymerase II subunit [Martiniozyma asiatica]